MKSFADRNRHKPQSIPLSLVLTALVLALAGQFFLAQSQISWTLWTGLALVAAAWWKMSKWPPFLQTAERKSSWGPIGLGLMAALALGPRLLLLSTIPVGLNQDQGFIGLGALRILREGWRPFWDILLSQVPVPLEFYSMAAWFGLAGASLLTLRLFYVLLSLASFPFLYAFLRRLAEPRVAMAALFFLAVMRWNWDEARSAQPGIEAPLFLLAMLLFFLNGVQNRSPFSLVAAAIVASLGFYAYQSLKVLSLLLWALMAFERGRFPDNWRFPRWISWLASLLPLLFALPLFHYLWVHHTLGKRESESFILGKILQSHSLFPLFSSISGMALMFNREGTSNPLHNLPGMRLLDDGTGVLFLLGLALAWKMRKERAGAYPLIGSVVMSLPGWLTFEPVPSHRYTGLMPFVVYFAALGGVGLYDAIRPAMKKNKVFLWGLVAVVLGAIAGQNAHTYFGLEASNLQCQEAAGPEQTYIGRQIGQLEKEAPGRYRFFLDPFFQHNPTVAFLGYSAADRTAPFEVSDWAKGKMPRDKDSAVFLAQDKSGVWFFLKTLFPHDVDGVFRGPDGQVDLFWDRVSVSDLQEMKEWRKGLEGIYIQSGLWTDPPMGSRLDPVINFASREDFPFDVPPPYRARWSGRLQIKTSGNYQFIVLSTDSAQLWLDGKIVALKKPFYLPKGSHPLRLDYEKDGGYYMALHLAWKRPNGADWEVVPAEAFGTIH